MAQIVDTIARQRGNHEGLRQGQAVIGRFRQREQLFARHEIDLVQDQDLLVMDRLDLFQDRVGLVVDAGFGIEQHADEIGVMRAAPGRRHHGAVEPTLRREDAGGVDQNDLRVVLDHDAADQCAGRLHLARHDGDLGADQRIDERGLADIGGADQRDEAAARGRRRGIGARAIRHDCRR